MAAYSANQTKLSELGAIEVLLKLLREEEAPEAVRIQASGALSNLCLNEEIAAAVSEQNGDFPLFPFQTKDIVEGD